MFTMANRDYLTKDCVSAMIRLFPDMVETVPNSYNGRALLRKPIEADRVNIIISTGGGGGPMSQAYAMSQGLADVAISGGDHAAPSAYDIYEAVKHIDSKKGYVFLYNNFMGDCLNNDMAEELCRLDGYDCRLFPIHDDCLSADADAPRDERTGIIGLMFLLKIASACSRNGGSLDQVIEELTYAESRLSTMGVTFDEKERVGEFGTGISGEPARIRRADCYDLRKAAAFAADYLMEDIGYRPGEKLHLLVNRSFSTCYEDAYMFAAAAADRLEKYGTVAQCSVGNYMFQIERYAFAISVISADEKLCGYLKQRCYTDSFLI